MKVKYLIFAIAFALLNVGCSEKKETPSDLNKRSEETETVLEQKFTKKGVPPLTSEKGVMKTWPVLEKSHKLCKDEEDYNDCFCKKSAFSGSVVIDGVRYTCR